MDIQNCVPLARDFVREVQCDGNDAGNPPLSMRQGMRAIRRKCISLVIAGTVDEREGGERAHRQKPPTDNGQQTIFGDNKETMMRSNVRLDGARRCRCCR